MQIQTHFESSMLEDILNKRSLKNLDKTLNLFIRESKPEINEITTDADLNLIFTSNESIRELNKNRRGLDKPTDVLSWKMFEEDMKTNLILGEIYISDEYVQNQANRKGVKIEQEVYLLIIHGFLHVCGYTHDNDIDEKNMNETTIDLLNQLGIDYSIELI